MTTPEQKARTKIDAQLRDAGWTIQDMAQANPAAAPGVAIREYPTSRGPADYALFVDQRPVGVLEAKRVEEGGHLSVHEVQVLEYAASTLKYVNNDEPLRFVFLSTGPVTFFADLQDPVPRFREVFSFFQPESLAKRLKEQESLRRRFEALPALEQGPLRDCQFNAITKLETSLKANKPRALIQMATGSGKTYTAITSIYRLLKYAKAKRILFLVDTRTLGEQAETEFQAYTPVDDQRKFTELYTVQRLSSRFIDKHSQVCISTIQRMYSILRGEELDGSVEDTNPNELQWKSDQTREVAYNPEVPVEHFDFIIIDECHRSIYNLWRQVLEYFDAYLIGLTATPDARTYGFFNENVVSEYTHEQAVADGVNVGYDIYTIETDITRRGALIRAGEFVDHRSKLTHEKRWTQLDDDLEYGGKDLDRNVVNKSQIRTVIRTFKERLFTEIFPGRQEVPKTLVFAKNDSHADDIIRIIREEFGEGNDFCKKITCAVKDEKPGTILQAFRNDYNPRIAVTVDMIATGTDVKPLECLLFMRDVKSSNYFTQMLGRGTRTLKGDDLKRVTRSAPGNKTHFIAVDAVGIFKSEKITCPRALDRKKSVPLKDLMMSVVMGGRDEDTLTTLAGRLGKLEKQVTDEQREAFTALSKGQSINAVVNGLLVATDPDVIEKKAQELAGKPRHSLPTDDEKKAGAENLAQAACAPFQNPKLREFVENARKQLEQVIDDVNLDKVLSAGYDGQAKDRAREIVNNFKAFIEQNKNEIMALRIFFSQPARRSELTFGMVQELAEKMQGPPYRLTLDGVWNAYYQLNPQKVRGTGVQRLLTDVVALLRFELGVDRDLVPYSETVNANFKEWVFKKNAGHVHFTDEQMAWLRMIKDHIVTSVRIEKDDFDNTPFAEEGGLGKVWQVFGDKLDELLVELDSI